MDDSERAWNALLRRGSEAVRHVREHTERANARARDAEEAASPRSSALLRRNIVLSRPSSSLMQPSPLPRIYQRKWLR